MKFQTTYRIIIIDLTRIAYGRNVKFSHRYKQLEAHRNMTISN